MGSDQSDEPASTGNIANRRNVLKTIGGVGIVGGLSAGAVSARGPPDDKERGSSEDKERGPPEDDDDPDERTIDWEGQGSEHAEQDCDGVGYWHWVLTPGGSTKYEEVKDLHVEFEGGYSASVSGSQSGNGAYHFNVEKAGGGEISGASVEVTGGGRNALLTISDGGCEEQDVLYWQVDFGEGPVRDPPKYWPDDFMAALGNSVDGVTGNPDHRRQQTEGQLQDVTIYDNSFSFDDDDYPTTVTVDFEVDEDGAERDLHLSSFVLPGPFDEDEIDEQELYDSTVITVGGGDSETLTIDVPQ